MEVQGGIHSWTPLFFAVVNNQQDVFECLVNHGATINGIDAYLEKSNKASLHFIGHLMVGFSKLLRI